MRHVRNLHGSKLWRLCRDGIQGLPNMVPGFRHCTNFLRLYGLELLADA